jgi:2-polyprenyl-3-methyl-5-hydroxy-6-metoxy-1,4-benzoquinol methylase
MKLEYWNKLAATFETDVFQPVANDLNGTILTALSSLASKNRSVADIGCGTGSLLPTLARQFQSVLAIDLSERCLKIAEKRNKHLSNLKLLQLDLTRKIPELKQIDVGVCLNVAIMPDYRGRMRLFENVTSLIAPNGRLLLLIPSLESVLLTIHRLVQWNLEECSSYRQAAAEASDELGFTAASIRDGIVKKGGTNTKHYLKEELEILTRELGFQLCSISKVEYSWGTEFSHPPDSMGAPYPWDWFVVMKPGGN